MKYFTLLFFIVHLAFFPAISQEKYTVTSDITFGYSVLSSDSNLFLSHHNYSEGLFVESFDFSITNTNGNGWFDFFKIKTRTGDRFDTGRKVSVTLKKHGLYLFTVSSKQDKDYFQNNLYNYGANNRDILKDNIQINFRWTGFSNIQLFTGFKQYSTTGIANKPFSEWGNIYVLQFDKDISYDEFNVGSTFFYKNFQLTARYSWISIDNNSDYRQFADNNVENSIYLENPEYTGSVNASIPTAFLKGTFNWEKVKFVFSYSKKDGSMDNNSIDLKNYFFEDYGSRTDKIIQLNGTSENPITESTLLISFSPFQKLSLVYDFSSLKTETTTLMSGSNTINLYGTGTTPIVTISDSIDNSFYYKNSKTRQGVTAYYSVFPKTTFTVAFHNVDGDIENNFDNTENLVNEDYSSDKWEASIKHRYKSSSIKGSFFSEDISNPVFRTAGAKKEGYNVSFVFSPVNKVSVNGYYSDLTTKDNSPGTSLNIEAKLYDVFISYSLKKGNAIGIGVTSIDYSNIINMLYVVDQNTEQNVENYDIHQQGFYVFVKYNSNKRLSAEFNGYYMEDTGSSFPLSNFIGKARVQFKLSKTVYAVISGAYFNYDEKNLALNTYSVNHFTVGFRWLLN